MTTQAQLSSSSPEPADRAGTGAAVRPLPRDDFDRDVWCLLGLPVDVIDVARAVDAVETAARGRRRLSFITPNVHWLVKFLRDPAVRRQTLATDLSVIDGAPLVALAKLLGIPVPGRVAGSDLFEALRLRPGFAGRRLRVFFFGGRDGAGETASRALTAGRGGLEGAGSFNPGFGDVESMSDAATIDAVNAAAPDFVIVSVSAAKGQAWIDRNKDRLTAPVLANLGAVVDFTAGTVRRAPAWVARFGLEWAWRIKEEPGLWRRYAGDGAALASVVLRRLLPQAAAARSPGGPAPAGAVVERDAAGATVRLSGDLVAGGLAPVRAAFREAAGAGRVRLDFEGVGRLDRAFLGLVLMLEKHSALSGGALETISLSKSHAAVFRRNAMLYPSGLESARPAADAAGGLRAAG